MGARAERPLLRPQEHQPGGTVRLYSTHRLYGTATPRVVSVGAVGCPQVFFVYLYTGTKSG